MNISVMNSVSNQKQSFGRAGDGDKILNRLRAEVNPSGKAAVSIGLLHGATKAVMDKAKEDKKPVSAKEAVKTAVLYLKGAVQKTNPPLGAQRAYVPTEPASPITRAVTTKFKEIFG